MAELKGILVRLKTKRERDAGTDDAIYVGIMGKGGGSEFPLDVRDFDDWEEGSDVKYWFGDVWEGSALSGAKRPWGATRWNHPGIRYIDLDKVDYVYLRKQSTKGGRGDDAWKMDEVEVTLYGPSPQKRTFWKTGDIWLGNEYGLWVYLKEKEE